MTAALACPSCGATYEEGPDEPWRCGCGHALEFAATRRPATPPTPYEDLDTRRGLWAFADFLPMERRVSLGEGFTPLVEASAWNASFKLESVLPSGSFKDRGATTTLSRAARLGVDRVVEDSSGNAGAAIAQYAARAGIEAEIFVPADAKSAKLRAIESAGATAVPIEGSRAAVTEACIERVETGEGWYASHAWNPAFFAGTATFALEVCAQRDWQAPDVVVCPLGHGTLLLGAYRGFRTLHQAGWIDRLPRLLAAQAAGCAPVVAALHGAGTATGDNDLADGIQIRKPARWTQIIDALEATGGDAIAVEGPAVTAALDALHRGGFYVEPTSAAAPAALRAYRDAGLIEPDEDVVVPLTGHGLKT